MKLRSVLLVALLACGACDSVKAPVEADAVYATTEQTVDLLLEAPLKETAAKLEAANAQYTQAKTLLDQRDSQLATIHKAVIDGGLLVAPGKQINFFDATLGTLKVVKGEDGNLHLTFEGNADEAAQVFFNSVIKRWEAEWAGYVAKLDAPKAEKETTP